MFSCVQRLGYGAVRRLGFNVVSLLGFDVERILGFSALAEQGLPARAILPRWTAENRQFVDRAKPAISGG
jgi:hypothetical protein